MYDLYAEQEIPAENGRELKVEPSEHAMTPVPVTNGTIIQDPVDAAVRPHTSRGPTPERISHGRFDWVEAIGSPAAIAAGIAMPSAVSTADQQRSRELSRSAEKVMGSVKQVDRRAWEMFHHHAEKMKRADSATGEDGGPLERQPSTPTAVVTREKGAIEAREKGAGLRGAMATMRRRSSEIFLGRHPDDQASQDVAASGTIEPASSPAACPATIHSEHPDQKPQDIPVTTTIESESGQTVDPATHHAETFMASMHRRGSEVFRKLHPEQSKSQDRNMHPDLKKIHDVGDNKATDAASSPVIPYPTRKGHEGNSVRSNSSDESKSSDSASSGPLHHLECCRYSESRELPADGQSRPTLGHRRGSTREFVTEHVSHHEKPASVVAAGHPHLWKPAQG
ncbi:hypothetical protein LTR22_024100 [Elasticomyces elasticus]|nr:hypothetical protein LTR22_024100 [Elasticomyces elasticus]KAK4906225.1 hypothetical protein LTR49_024588 [Elasticomyces elasticus]